MSRRDEEVDERRREQMTPIQDELFDRLVSDLPQRDVIAVVDALTKAQRSGLTIGLGFAAAVALDKDVRLTFDLDLEQADTWERYMDGTWEP